MAPIQVEAKDDVGVVAVQFLLNGTPVETVTAPPFSWNWTTTNFANGNWFLSAIASDAAGKTSDPAVVEVVVANSGSTCGEAPKVKLVYPTDKAVVCGDLSIDTAASGPCTVAKVEFFVDGQKVGEAASKPFKAVWKTTNNKDGQHFLKAVATDGAGQAAQQTITVTVDNKKTQCVNAPTVNITKPAEDTYVFGTIDVEAEASAGGDIATIISVLFSVDKGSIGVVSTVPWATQWLTDKFAEGPHTLRATAKDDLGNSGAHEITVNIDRTPPTVVLVSPDDAAVVNGDSTPITVAADASDNLALVSVAFSAAGPAGTSAALGATKVKPWQVLWNSATALSGTWTLTATALDAAGHIAQATRSVTLDRDPTLVLTGPSTSGSLAGVVDITGTAKDDLGLAGDVMISIDGSPFTALTPGGGGQSVSFPFSTPWFTTQATYGEHTILASVKDSNGHTATASLKVNVDQPLAMTLSVCNSAFASCGPPPSSASTEFSGKLYLTVAASDDNASVTGAALLLNGKVVASLAAPPWQFTWDSAGVADGSQELGVRITTDLPQNKEQAFGLTVNNCDLDHDKQLATGGACGGEDCNDGDAKTYAGAASHVFGPLATSPRLLGQPALAAFAKVGGGLSRRRSSPPAFSRSARCLGRRNERGVVGRPPLCRMCAPVGPRLPVPVLLRRRHHSHRPKENP